jgi:hypothetical protein
MLGSAMATGTWKYRSYLLRLWSEQSAGKLVWRASLEEALTRERRSFASLDDLVSFLYEETEDALREGAGVDDSSQVHE